MLTGVPSLDDSGSSLIKQESAWIGNQIWLLIWYLLDGTYFLVVSGFLAYSVRPLMLGHFVFCLQLSPSSLLQLFCFSHRDPAPVFHSRMEEGLSLNDLKIFLLLQNLLAYRTCFLCTQSGGLSNVWFWLLEILPSALLSFCLIELTVRKNIPISCWQRPRSERNVASSLADTPKLGLPRGSLAYGGPRDTFPGVLFASFSSHASATSAPPQQFPRFPRATPPVVQVWWLTWEEIPVELGKKMWIFVSAHCLRGQHPPTLVLAGVFG